MKALIVGGGVAGLSAAAALRLRGFEVELFERAPEIRDIGAGKTLWNNGVQALEALGVADAVVAAGSPLHEIRVLTWRDRVLQRIPVAGRSVAVQRTDVLEALARAVPAGIVRTSARCVGFEQDAAGVTAYFEDGRTARGDLLVGADGINSAIRARLFPEWEPRYAGHVAWRGIAEFAHDRWPVGISFNWYGRGKHFALVPLLRGRMFWYATKNLPQDAPNRGKDDVLEYFSDGAEGTHELIRATSPEWIVRNRLYDLRFRRRWGAGRVVLIGDAAHAMRPNLGQGACTALEDAVVLARCLEAATDPTPGLEMFQRSRRRRVWWIHRWSEITSRLQLLERPAACWLRDVSVWAQPGPLVARTFVKPILRFGEVPETPTAAT